VRKAMVMPSDLLQSVLHYVFELDRAAKLTFEQIFQRVLRGEAVRSKVLVRTEPAPDLQHFTLPCPWRGTFRSNATARSGDYSRTRATEPETCSDCK
jgi:hypothetical protein